MPGQLEIQLEDVVTHCNLDGCESVVETRAFNHLGHFFCSREHLVEFLEEEKNSRLTRHHKKCKANGGNSKLENIALVNAAKHTAWHTMWHSMTPKQIAEEINRNWIDSDKCFICVDSEYRHRVEAFINGL